MSDSYFPQFWPADKVQGHFTTEGVDLDLDSDLSDPDGDNTLSWKPTDLQDPDQVARLVGYTNGLGAGLAAILKDANANELLAVLLNYAGESIFPQLAFTGTGQSKKVLLDYGADTINGVGTVTGQTTVNHKLGGVPTGAIAFPQSTVLSGGGAGRLILSRFSWTPTQITYIARSNNDAVWNTAVTFYWLAWREA